MASVFWGSGHPADEVADFDEYDPTPYGGGYDIALTFGRALPPSDEICHPISTASSSSSSYDRPQQGRRPLAEETHFSAGHGRRPGRRRGDARRRGGDDDDGSGDERKPRYKKHDDDDDGERKPRYKKRDDDDDDSDGERKQRYEKNNRRRHDYDD
ncbi:hypothetical protein OsJ_08352 [Oryza sativa Japonica Group]|uniref:Uncharacterized protein n=1 Tax=Oryza sativa subsp. japonica TaxID=39947 RepID=A3ABA2_ORYSJ|nr:hypothetical protein OsJ_08352 [Oryza sativa Japonica Group]